MYNIPGITGIAGTRILSMNFLNFVRGYSGGIIFVEIYIPGIIMRKLNSISDIPGIRGYR
jgi:hypothetical protein